MGDDYSYSEYNNYIEEPMTAAKYAAMAPKVEVDVSLVISIIALITAIGCDPKHIDEVLETIGKDSLGSSASEMVRIVTNAIDKVEKAHYVDPFVSSPA